MHHRHPQQLRVRAYILPAAYSFGARHGAGARWHGQSRDAIRCILAKAPVRMLQRGRRVVDDCNFGEDQSFQFECSLVAAQGEELMMLLPLIPAAKWFVLINFPTSCLYS